jgi:hypothetical protein
MLQTSDPFYIPALAVGRTIPSCEIKTVVEYWNEWGCEEMTDPVGSTTASEPMECNGAWYEFYDELATFDQTTMKITWELTQDHWFNSLQYIARYASKAIVETLEKEGHDALMNYRPKNYKLVLRFKTYDQSCYDCEVNYDKVDIVIENSGELQGQLCDYSSITVDTPMTANKKYEV